MYDNPEICSECGGKCCKEYPGIAFPSDFDMPNTEKLKAALESGKWAIDWWDGDPRGDGCDSLDRAYFIRPATIDRVGKLLDASWGGQCVFLSDSGCVIKSDERPLNCRMVEPRADGDCINHFRDNNNVFIKRASAIEWMPYTETILNIIESITKTRKDNIG